MEKKEKGDTHTTFRRKREYSVHYCYTEWKDP